VQCSAIETVITSWSRVSNKKTPHLTLPNLRMPLITTFIKVSADVLSVYKYIQSIVSVNEGKSWKHAYMARSAKSVKVPEWDVQAAMRAEI